jgi:hypothetical protein
MALMSATVADPAILENVIAYTARCSMRRRPAP